MNRRALVSTFAAAVVVPTAALASQSAATPQSSPVTDGADSTTRDLVRNLAQVSPVTLLEALETTPITNSILLEASGDEATAVPWTDFGDTDLYSSLGGVILTPGETALSDPETEMLGGYIVYESAEIAYHEVVRKLGSAYDNPAMTSSAAGTNIFVLDVDDFQIGVCRVGYVMIMALMNQSGAKIAVGHIQHLAEVAESLL